MVGREMTRIAFYATIKPPDHHIASGDRLIARNLMAALSLAGYGVDLASRKLDAESSCLLGVGDAETEGEAALGDLLECGSQVG